MPIGWKKIPASGTTENIEKIQKNLRYGIK